ncbi:MAG: hypothetical protein V3W51_05415 [Candidatus Brocadiales bacterium]
MLRILLIISLVFSLSLSSGMGHLYAKCRPGHDDGGGGSTSSPSGGGGGMSGAAGAAAGFGLLLNLLQATSAQEDVDLDALVAEYDMAFYVIDPTVSIIVLAGGLTGVDIAAANPEGKPVCSCNAVGNNCACPKDLACGGARHVVQWDGESGGVLSAEWVCGGASGGGTRVLTATTSSEDLPECFCNGEGCTCPEDLACGGATYNETTHKFFCGGVSGGGTRVLTATTSSEDLPDCFCNGDGCTCPEDLACGGATYNETTHKFFCGGATLGGTRVLTATTPSEDKPVCGCGGGNCACPKEDACKVQFYRGEARKWSRQVMDGAPPPRGMFGATPVELWNHYRKKSEEAEKRCK